MDGVRFPGDVGIFFRRKVVAGYGALPASYLVDDTGSEELDPDCKVITAPSLISTF
jgi:hypothetical protein